MSARIPSLSPARVPGSGVTAVLGPTNTGKTHLAIERMLGHSSGLIGLPLRLLAREVYNRLVERAGVDAVALVTGEEKIKPPHARYWVATVEAMPTDLDVAFVAIDEIQIAADLERGHVFTDRILNRRGRDETLILGAATMRGVVERLLPGVSILTRPRLSQLDYSGDRKLTRQPRRTAIVAFSAEEVYAIAELIRRQRGGAAVVLGALSPRTRNAQVALYQSGDVDYLVATDAIGMGLNLDVDHVAFASDRKYDGYQYRRLNPAEFAQIAGRAGRAMRDGTFGTTGRCPPFEPELVNALQNHTFEPVKLLQWRNSDLDFASIGALQATLSGPPAHEVLARAPVAEDIRVLDHLARDEQIRALAHGRAAVERLWEVCQLPDYRKIAPAAHAELIATLYGFLMRQGSIPADWLGAQIAQADRTDGDIDTLSARIAHIRTWSFAVNRPHWLASAEHWQETTRAIEDKLSDALHERLTERFVDRRTSVLMRRLRENAMLETEIAKSGDVIVEGHVIGRLEGFLFAPGTAEAGSDAKALQAAAQKALAGEIDARAEKLAACPDDQVVLASDGVLRWIGEAVGRVVAADDTLRPRVVLLADERLTGATLEKVQSRLDQWLKTHIEKVLAPLIDLGRAEDITGIARGIAFQIVEALGVLERSQVANDIKGLDQPARATLRKYGVRFGAYHIYVPSLLKPAPRALAALLWSLRQSGVDLAALTDVQHLAASGRTSFPANKELPRDAYRVLGYKLAGERGVRVDILERLADLIRPALAWRPVTGQPRPAGGFDGHSFVVTQDMTSLTGAAGEDFSAILRALGYRMDRKPRLPDPAPVVAAPLPTAEGAPGATVAAPEGDAATTMAVAEESAAAPAENAADAPLPGADDSAAAVSQEDIGTTAEASAPASIATAEDDVTVAEVEPATDEAASAADTIASAEAAAQFSVPAEEESAPAQPEGMSAGVEAEGDSSSSSSDAAAAPGEPELIEVWRPGRMHDGPRERHHHRARRGAEQAGDGAQTPHRRRHRARHGHEAANSAATETPAPDATSPPSPRGAAEGEGQRDRGPHRHRHRRGGEREERPAEAGRDAGARRPEGRGKRHGKPFEGRGDDRRNRDRGHGREDRGDARPRVWGDTERKDRALDPNSPFAKLAALKEQLEANKDRS